MGAEGDHSLTVLKRRHARKLAYWNGGLWAIGNGMTSTTLVIYLALELHMPRVGLGISLIKAAAQFAGLLRLAAPAMIDRLADRKRFCLTTYLASGLVLWGLPLAAAPGWLPSAGASLAALVTLWCLYHLLEYLGTVALWSWLADLAPGRIRGRFLGGRERWMAAGQMAGMLATALGCHLWKHYQSESPLWTVYAILAAMGAAFLIVSLLPLAKMPSLGASAAARPPIPLRSILTPFFDPRFVPFLIFGCWCSFFSGLTQAAQEIYPYRVLDISLGSMLVLRTFMRLGQIGISPWMGRLADRFGNRPVLAGSLPIVAGAILFYWLASPAAPWWIAGAWVAWIAWAGVNVTQPNLMLGLSPTSSRAAYVAAFLSVTGLCLAGGTILGGVVFDHFDTFRSEWLSGLGRVASWDRFQFFFLVSWVTRTLALLFLLPVTEPKKPR